jgi:hypothetical protein
VGTPTITVQKKASASDDAHADAFAFVVRVAERGGESRHDVTLARRDLERLARSGETPESFVERCFRFLLAREPKESILGRFDVSVIARYFDEFEREIQR